MTLRRVNVSEGWEGRGVAASGGGKARHFRRLEEIGLLRKDGAEYRLTDKGREVLRANAWI